MNLNVFSFVIGDLNCQLSWIVKNYQIKSPKCRKYKLRVQLARDKSSGCIGVIW